MNCQRVPIHWPQTVKLLQILNDLEVDYPDALELIGRLNIFKPYLLQLQYESQFDFLYVLNGLMTRLVFTPRNEWDQFVSRMVAAICEQEHLTDSYNASLTSGGAGLAPEASACHALADATCPDAPALDCQSTLLAEPSLTSEVELPIVGNHGSIQEQRNALHLPEACSKDEDKRRPTEKNPKPRNSRLQAKTHQSDFSLADTAASLTLHDSSTINSLMKNVNKLKKIDLVEYRRQALDKKYKYFTSVEALIPSSYDSKAKDLYILQKLTTHLADTDWIRFKGISRNIQDITFRILDRRK